VAAIVGSHGGSVRVEGTDGGGATLVVSLPFRTDSPGPDGQADGLTAHGQADGTDVAGSGVESIGTFSDSAGGNRLST
jgi:two-component system OmpR family sensor kinase